MSDESQPEIVEQTIPMSYRDLLSVGILGAAVGLVTWVVGYLLNRYVFDAFFCQNAESSQCAYADDYAAAVALVLGSVAALVGLIRLRVYRPLLIVLASAFSLWGLLQISWGMAWYAGLIVAVLLSLLAYGLYAWVARIRVFWIAILATVLLVVAVRLAIMQ